MNELINKTFKVFKKLQKLDESDFEGQVECQQTIFKYMLEMTDRQINEYNSKCDEFLKKSNKEI